MSNEMVVTENKTIVTSGADQNILVCSVADDGTRKSKIVIYNAISNPQHNLAELINSEIAIVDVIVHDVELVDDETGELVQTKRVILIDVKGETYVAVSQGIVNSIYKLMAIIGQPSWKDEPVIVKVKQVKTRNGNNKVLTLELIG